MKTKILKEFSEYSDGSGDINKDYFGQQPRALGFTVKTSSQRNPDTSYYKMIAMKDPFQKKAFYSAADYYLKIEIVNLKYVYAKDDSTNAEKWWLSEAQFHIALKDVSSNNDVSYVDIKNFYKFKSNDSYENLATTLIEEQIAPQLSTRSIDFGTSIDPSNFFMVFYSYLGAMFHDLN